MAPLQLSSIQQTCTECLLCAGLCVLALERQRGSGGVPELKELQECPVFRSCSCVICRRVPLPAVSLPASFSSQHMPQSEAPYLSVCFLVCCPLEGRNLIWCFLASRIVSATQSTFGKYLSSERLSLTSGMRAEVSDSSPGSATYQQCATFSKRLSFLILVSSSVKQECFSGQRKELANQKLDRQRLCSLQNREKIKGTEPPQNVGHAMQVSGAGREKETKNIQRNNA